MNLKLILSTSCLAASAYVAHAQLIFWDPANGGNGHYYQPVLTLADWETANTAAVAQGGYLVSLTSAAENDFVSSLVQNPAYWSTLEAGGNVFGLGPWLGGLQPAGSSEPDGGWLWSSGEGLLANTYTHWDVSQPDEFLAQDQNRLSFYSRDWNTFGVQKTWDDANGLGQRTYIIEYSASPVPEPEEYAAFAGIALVAFGIFRRVRR